ncbi:MAG: DUF2087 domain-containing protein [Caldilineaceae bacterium]
MTQVRETSEAITPAERQAALLNLGKLLLDPDRLKILGLLAQQPCTPETLTTELAVERVQVHLQKLQESGLVHKQEAQGATWYQLDQQQIFKLKKLLFARPEEPKGQSAEEKDLAKFVKEGQLVQLPVRPAQLQLVLAWLAEQFEPGVLYAEKQVNVLLQGHTIDHVTLRRLLIDHRLLVRQAGIYQRSASA